MLASRPAMQLIIGANGVERAGDFDAEPGFFRLADRATDGSLKTIEEGRSAGGQVEFVTEKREGRAAFADQLPERFAAAPFGVLPAASFALLKSLLDQGLKSIGRSQRFAVIGKRKCDTPFAGKPALRFHHRQHGFQLVAACGGEVKRLVSVSEIENPGPLSAGKNAVAGMRRETGVPVGTCQRIFHLQTQGFHGSYRHRTGLRTKHATYMAKNPATIRLH